MGIQSHDSHRYRPLFRFGSPLHQRRRATPQRPSAHGEAGIQTAPGKDVHVGPVPSTLPCRVAWGVVAGRVYDRRIGDGIAGGGVCAVSTGDVGGSVGGAGPIGGSDTVLQTEFKAVRIDIFIIFSLVSLFSHIPHLPPSLPNPSPTRLVPTQPQTVRLHPPHRPMVCPIHERKH